MYFTGGSFKPGHEFLSVVFVAGEALADLRPVLVIEPTCCSGRPGEDNAGLVCRADWVSRGSRGSPVSREVNVGQKLCDLDDGLVQGTVERQGVRNGRIGQFELDLGGGGDDVGQVVRDLSQVLQ